MTLSQILKRIRIRMMKRYGAAARRVQGVPLYAQGLEDLYLIRLFGKEHKGFYVDVGANDGIFVSNTYALSRRGWRGICIDPNPEAFAALTRNRPQDVCLNVAIGSAPGEVELAWQEGITEGSSVGRRAEGSRSCKVRLSTLTEVLREQNAPHDFELLSIDVEGMEDQVLGGLDWTEYRPRLVIMEYNGEGQVNMDAFDLLLRHGYRPILINRWNILFSREWNQDMLRVHRGQDWYSLDKLTF